MAALSPSSYIVPILTAALLAAAGCSSPDSDTDKPAVEAEVCPADALENVVDAAPWALARAGIASYRYAADVAGGESNLELRDDTERTLATLRVRQIFGDPDAPSGAMEGVLKTTEGTVRLITSGEDVDRDGYTVRMRLESAERPTFHITARFETVPCWVDDGNPVAGPLCALRLPLGAGPFTLPGCGLIVDERIRERLAPSLTRLTYAVAADEAGARPAAGGFGREGARLFHTLSVLSERGLTDEGVVSSWLAQTGADALVGSSEERLLTTAFLDRTWWRVLEQHVAHCEVARLPRPQPGDGTRLQTLCPGDSSSSDWGSARESQGAKVWGDPHLVTFDGFSYGLQATGEYVLFVAHRGDPLIMQGRFEPLGNPPVAACANVTRGTAVATEVDGRRLTVSVLPVWEVRLDGVAIKSSDDLPLLGDGTILTVGPGEVDIRWPGGETAELREVGSGDTVSLSLNAALPLHRRGQIRGLFGQFDGDTSTDLVLPDGTVLDQPISFEDTYEVLAPAWRVTPESSRFHYAAGAGPDTFYIPGFPNAPLKLADLPAALRDEAEATCLKEDIADAHLLAACILDVVCFADSSQASDAARAPKPRASQLPGEEDVVVDRAIRRVPAPASLDDAPEPERGQCRPRVAPKIALFHEQSEVLLDADLSTAITKPGTYTRQTLPAPTTLAAGTAVTSYHLVSRPTPGAQHPVSGTARFARPILAVIVEPSQTTATDAALGAPATTYEAGDFQALRSAEDVVEVSDDGRTLRVVWGGAAAHRLRVLTEPR